MPPGLQQTLDQLEQRAHEYTDEQVRAIEQAGRDLERRFQQELKKHDRELRAIRGILRVGAPELLRLLFKERANGTAALGDWTLPAATATIELDVVDQPVHFFYVWSLVDMVAGTAAVMMGSGHSLPFAGNSPNLLNVQSFIQSTRGANKRVTYALVINNHTGAARSIHYLAYRFAGLGGAIA